MHARSFKKRGYFRYFHIAVVVIALTLPFVTIARTFEKGGFTVTRFPNFVCAAADPDVLFYWFNFFFRLNSGAGVIMITIMFWKLAGIVREKVAREKSMRRKRTVSPLIYITVYTSISRY